MDHRQLLKFFKGLWQFSRTIRSLSADAQLIGSISEGKASWLPWQHQNNESQLNSDWLLYREEGHFTNVEHPAATGRVTRQYLYDFSEPLEIKAFHCNFVSKQQNTRDSWNTDVKCEDYKVEKFFHNFKFSGECETEIMGISSDATSGVSFPGQS